MDFETTTVADFVEAGQEAIENWDFEVFADEGYSDQWIEAYKDALDFDEEYAEETFANEYGVVEITPYSDKWDKLAEFALNMANQT